MMCRKVCRRAFSPAICAKPSGLSRPWAAIAALPMSISVPAALKSAALLAVKKTPAVAANQAPMPGKLICAGPPIPSTTVVICHWRKGLRFRSSDTTYRLVLELSTVAGPLSPAVRLPIQINQGEFAMPNRRHFITNIAGLAAASAVPFAFAQSAGESTMARIKRTKVLRIGGVRGQAPYYNKDLVSGEWVGFMIDFAKSLAASLDVKLEVLETTWGNSVLDLQTRKIDVFFGMNPTPVRREAVGFSEPLFNNAFTVVAKKGFTPKTWAELNNPNVKIGVDIGSSHDQMISRVCPNATIVRLEKADDATLALQTGRVDVQVLVWLLALNVLKKNPSLGTMIVPMPLEATSTNIGVPKEDDKAWLEYVNKWIVQERAAGKIKATVLENLQKLSGVRPEDVPPQIPL